MKNPRQRVVVRSLLALLLVWGVAAVAYFAAKGARVTPEKVISYVDSTDLDKLSGEPRARAIRRLADMLNRLSFEERQRLRIGRAAEKWFLQMNEEEKSEFIEATMPTGFKQMIAVFEEMPEDKRRRAIDESVKRMRDVASQSRPATGTNSVSGTNRPPPLSPELEAKVRTIGLKSFYSESSAQTKAELAPLLEEMQRAMESGRMMRGR